MKSIIIANASSLTDAEAVWAVYRHMLFGIKPSGAELKETNKGIEKLYMLEDKRQITGSWKENIMQKFERVE